MPKKKIIHCLIILYIILFGISIYMFNAYSKGKYRCNFKGRNIYIQKEEIINNKFIELNTEELSEFFSWFISLTRDNLVLNISNENISSKSRIKNLTDEQKKIIAGYIVQPRFGRDFHKMPSLFNGKKLLSVSIKYHEDSLTELIFYDFDGFVWLDVFGEYSFCTRQGLAENFYLYMKGLL